MVENLNFQSHDCQDLYNDIGFGYPKLYFWLLSKSAKKIDFIYIAHLNKASLHFLPNFFLKSFKKSVTKLRKVKIICVFLKIQNPIFGYLWYITSVQIQIDKTRSFIKSNLRNIARNSSYGYYYFYILLPGATTNY